MESIESANHFLNQIENWEEKMEESEKKNRAVEMIIANACRLMCSQQVEVNEEASNMLTLFFKESRKLRNKDMQQLSISSLNGLISISKAVACICGRTCVVNEDAVVAINLIEESLVAKFGTSVLSFKLREECKRNLDTYCEGDVSKSFLKN